jgi:hypothetical protein
MVTDPLTDYSEVRQRAEKIRRLQVVMIALPALCALLMYLVASNFEPEEMRYRFGLSRELLLLASVTLMAVSGLSLMFTYLQTGFKWENASAKLLLDHPVVSHEQAETTAAIRRHEADIEALREEMRRTRADLGGLDSQSRGDLIADIKATLQNEGSAAILEEIRAKVASAEAKSAQEKELAGQFEGSRSRLQRELQALGWRGNLNLALGAATTIVGISLLGFNVFAETSTAKDLWALASHFAPRLALVLLIEVFAFFFLSLYKSSLSEIKYFQNELTNIELKQIALSSAIAAKDATGLSEIIGKLAATERNHILSKDQTTIELEKVRIDRDSQNNLAKTMAEFFQKKG